MKHILSNELKLILVPIKIEDKKALFTLMNEVYRHSYRKIWKDEGDWYVNLIYSEENVAKELGRTPTHYFFVEWKEEKIGILKYDFPFSPTHVPISKAMKIHRLYLHEKAHGKGIAALLMSHTEEIAKQHHLETLWLEVMEFQLQAKRFYEKCGYQSIYSYQLDFEKILPEYRGIEIWSKEIKM